ncbi:hypothetical protein AK830_g6068 [Neonectria ditissima]|uniref:DUF7600 domain-containing protein n=1 Tax=Neonectria ditissima TaxID=78410 RepID=A0A0P7ART6_9HYPO|nr:hypothetical protein AK830_g6068 [Neonectria ditissima]
MDVSISRILLADSARAGVPAGKFQEPKRVAELLFDFVYCLPYDRCYFPFPAHDFGGASQFLHLPEIPHGPWEFLQADPNALSLISSIATSHATADWFRETAEGVADRFSCLSLKLSSRTIASLTKPRDLPQSFWASRFRADMEMGFFPLEFESTGFFNLKVDWRRRYFNVKHALRDRTQTGHVRNRRRVWQSLGHLTQCLVPILFQNPIPRDGSCTELSSSEYKLGQLVQGLLRQNSSRYGGMGMRLFRTEHLLFSSLKSDAKSVHISVSSLNFNCTEYICGMRVFQDGIEVSCAGLFMPRSEIHISITPQDHLRSIRVASFVCGIVGIGFELEDATGYRSWKTAGILDNPPDGVGIATLEPRAGHEVCGAMIGFDLLESQLDSIVPNGTSPSTAIPMPWLWHPIEPDSCANQMILGCPPEQQQAPLEPTFVLNMDFGGPGGSHLSRLNRVTALHDDYYGSFRGFHFFYTDGTKRMFGTRQIIDTMSKRWTCIEQSFALDGPGGERITSLYFGREDTAHGMFVQVIKKGLVWGFSHDCDYIHVVTRPPEFNLEFTLVLHNILDFWPNSRIPGKLFWQIQGLEANWISISQIHAVFSEDRRLSGFVFEYGKGQLYNHVGHIEGAMASMSLNDSERVTRMDVSVGVGEDEVIFYTSTNRMCSLVAPYSNSESNDRSSSDFEIFMLEDPPGSETDHLPASDGTLVDSSHLADGNNCVGIWVTMKIFPRAMNVVEAVGPIFAQKIQ